MTFENMLGLVVGSFLVRLVGVILLVVHSGILLTLLAVTIYAVGPIMMWYAIIQYKTNRKETACPTKSMQSLR